MNQIDMGRDKRQLLLNSSIELYRERGFHRTRVEDIISHAKVGKGTFYLYFKNKDEVVSVLLEEFLGEILGILDWVEGSLLQSQPVNDVFSMEAVKIYDLLEKRKKLAQFLFREASSISPEVHLKIREYYRQIADRIERTFQLGLKMGFLKNFDPKYASWSVMGSILYIYQLWLEDEVKDSPEVIMEKVLGFYLGALNVGEASPP